MKNAAEAERQLAAPNWPRAWELYHTARFNLPPGRALRSASRPLWTGAPVQGKRLLLWADAGFGDTLQFCRFAPLIRDRFAAQVTLEVQPALLPLLENQWPGIEVVARGGPPKQYDTHCPLFAISIALRLTVRQIPAIQRYLRAPSPAAARTLPYVGLAWKGSNGTEVGSLQGRSVPVAQLAPLGIVPLLCLQKDRHEIETARFRMYAPPLDQEAPFVQTAAIMERLPLIVTSDTVTAHLAAALGRPTYLMLHETPEWRWQLEEAATPWYPTIRIFRKRAGGTWTEVAERIADEIRLTL